MFRKRAASFAAIAAAGVLLLSACNSDADNDGAAAPSASAAKSDATAAKSNAVDLSFKSGTAKSNDAAPKTGDWATKPGAPATSATSRRWVQLTASKAGNLDPVVVNGAGFTLYRFDNDTAMPSKSNCNGDCATTWPPVLVDRGSKIFVDGVDPSAVGVVRRDDGTLQVTIGGWPAYRFSKDTKPGDTNGQGVGGTWFGLTPDGQKAGQAGGGDDAEAGDAQTTPATSAILFDDANFADNGAQGLSGTGCQNVARDDIASSISVSGSMKIWTEADCTGKSKVINGDVADLAGIGFDDDVSSVFFG